MNLLSDVITYVRRIIKSPSNSVISDTLIIDYINRFWIMDVDARMQLFDLKTKYSFQTTPGVDKYNMPLYSLQTSPNPTISADGSTNSIAMYPVYQGFLGPAYVNGVQVGFHTQKEHFYGGFPNIVQNLSVVAIGDGGSNYTIQLPIIGPPVPPNPPFNGILRGHIDMAGIISTGNNIDPPIQSGSSALLSIPAMAVTSVESAVYFTSIGPDGASVVVADSGQFLNTNVNIGFLMRPGKAPLGNLASPNGYVNSFVITAITQATQAVFTAANTLQPGQSVTILGVVGMTELNGNTYTVVSATATTVTLDVDSSGFTPYVSGGTINVLQNFINYFTGEANVTFPSNIPAGVNINAQCYYFQSGLPRAILFNNNTLTLRVPPAMQYLVELDAYLSPAAFLTTSTALPFGYMAEYIARGAARKILSDTGDVEQFQFYEPLFREQELLVWKRSQRQWTATRTETIYSQGSGSGPFGNNGFGGYSI